MRNVLPPFIVAGLLIFTSWTRALGGDEGPSLARIVPEDVHFHGAFRTTADGLRLLEPYRQAFRELVRSGIGKDILDLITVEMPAEKKEEVLAIIRKVIGILRIPQWGQLLREEFSLSYRLSFPLPEYLVLFRVPPEAAPERLAEFRRAFDGIAELARGSLKVSEATLEGASAVRLQPENVPIGLTAAAKKGVIALATSENILRSAFLLMDSPDGKGSLAASQRMASVRQGLPAAGTNEAFVDLPGIIGFVRGVLDMAAGSTGDPDAAAAISIGRTVLDELSLLGPIGSAGIARGDVSIAETKVALGQRDGPGFFEKLIAEQEPIPFLRVVPKDAADFFLTTGINPTRVYDAIAGLIRDRFPRGPAALEKWGEVQSRIRFNLREDLLSWLDGGCGWIQIPAGASGPGGTVVFFRLEDEEKARQKLLEAAEKVKAFLKKRGQSLDIVESSELGEMFREIRIGAFPDFRPIVGIPGSTLVFSTSADAVKRIIATFRGEAPGFEENPAFAALGYTREPIHTVYYRDLRDTLRDLADLTAGAGLVLSLLPRERDTKPLIILGSILTKLAPFLRAIDRGVDEGGWDRYDAEKHAIFSHQAARVKAPQ